MTKHDLLVASTQHHRARLLKYYPRPPCAPSFVRSKTLRPLQTHFLLFQQIFFVLVCIHPGTPRVPPRVLASGPKPCGGKKELPCLNQQLYHVNLSVCLVNSKNWSFSLKSLRVCCYLDLLKINLICNGNGTEWSTIQGVIGRVI